MYLFRKCRLKLDQRERSLEELKYYELETKYPINSRYFWPCCYVWIALHGCQARVLSNLEKSITYLKI